MTFGSESTTDDVLEGVDLSGQRVVITGASAGLGQETARALTRRNGVRLCSRQSARPTGYEEPPKRAIAARPGPCSMVPCPRSGSTQSTSA